MEKTNDLSVSHEIAYFSTTKQTKTTTEKMEVLNCILQSLCFINYDQKVVFHLTAVGSNQSN